MMIEWGRADNEILERDFPFSGIYIYKKTTLEYTVGCHKNLLTVKSEQHP